MHSYQVRSALDVKAEVGEAPLWCAEQQALYWIDNRKFTINRFDPASDQNIVWPLPSKPGCFVLRENNGAIVAARDGFYDIDFAEGVMKKLFDAPYNATIFHFNDGKPDRRGYLCVGSMVGRDLSRSERAPFRRGGVLYRFDGDTLTPCIAPIAASNGTAFSPDGKILYRADTGRQRIYAHDYDMDTGVTSHERIFAEVPKELGFPDGATVDADGGYWVALLAGNRGGGIARFTSDGSLDVHIETPVPVPTMVAFGGADLSTLYVTSARLEHELGLEAHALSGDIFAIETPFQGLQEAKLANRAHLNTRKER